MPTQRPVKLARRKRSEKQECPSQQSFVCSRKGRSQAQVQGLSECLRQWLARQRIQSSWRQVSHGQVQWLSKSAVGVALAGGLPKNGLMSKQVSPAVASQAKNAGVTQPVDHPSVFLPKHQKPHQNFPRKRKESSSVKKQAQSVSAINIKERSAARILTWHPNQSKTSAGPLPITRVTQKLARRRLPMTRNITLLPKDESTGLSFLQNEGQEEFTVKVVVI